jgi:hypothetical protein
MKCAIVFPLLLCTLGGCTENLPPLDEITSLRVELAMPVDPGSREARLPDTVTSAQIVVTAIDARGEDADLDGPVKVYAQFLGTLTPTLGSAQPLATVMLTDGVSQPSTVTLPRVYGPTVLWVEDDREGGTFPTGTSPILWFRDPFVADISTPRDPMALDALESSPLEDKQINVSGSRYGASGRMVVTGVYAQGYTLSDSDCADADGTPPCVTGDYDHIFVFSFNRPRGEDGEAIAVGDVVERLTGSIAEFNGLTEVNFPQSFMSGEGSPEMVPEPFVLQPEWLSDVIMMERVEEALVAVEGVEICPLDEDFDTFAQWKLMLGGSCDDRDVINVITRGQVNDFDPTAYVGMVMPRVVGTLRPVNIGSFNVWILHPRSIEDIELP